MVTKKIRTSGYEKGFQVSMTLIMYIYTVYFLVVMTRFMDWLKHLYGRNIKNKM